VLNWENRKKGKHSSRKANGVVHDENQETTVFVSFGGIRARPRRFKAKAEDQIVRFAFVQKKL
jgi:hypothetical protein